MAARLFIIGGERIVVEGPSEAQIDAVIELAIAKLLQPDIDKRAHEFIHGGSDREPVGLLDASMFKR